MRLRALLPHQLTNMVDPQGNRQERSQHECIRDDEITADIQSFAEETDQNDDRKSQKGKKSFHFCDFARVR
jgi:hypothetical protein